MRDRPVQIRHLAALTAVVGTLMLPATAPGGDEEGIIRGSLIVKGTRWENGVVTRVSCNSSIGGFVNAGPTTRLFALAPAARCTIAGDGEGLPPSPYGAFRFSGAGQQVIDRGKPKAERIFAAFPTTPNVEGLLVATTKLSRSGEMLSEKGVVLYTQEVEGGVIQFDGTYRARFPR